MYLKSDYNYFWLIQKQTDLKGNFKFNKPRKYNRKKIKSIDIVDFLKHLLFGRVLFCFLFKLYGNQ